MSAFRATGEEIRYRGPYLTVVGASFESPTGEPFAREFVRHPGAVAVVVLVDDGTAALLVRQFRAAIGDELLELPAGLLDVEGESEDASARRELEEEVGRRVVGELEELVEFVPTAGMADHRVRIYLCRASEPCPARPHGPEEDHMTIERVALAEVPDLIARGAITDGKTIIGLLLALGKLS